MVPIYGFWDSIGRLRNSVLFTVIFTENVTDLFGMEQLVVYCCPLGCEENVSPYSGEEFARSKRQADNNMRSRIAFHFLRDMFRMNKALNKHMWPLVEEDGMCFKFGNLFGQGFIKLSSVLFCGYDEELAGLYTGYSFLLSRYHEKLW